MGRREWEGDEVVETQVFRESRGAINSNNRHLPHIYIHILTAGLDYTELCADL